jgi:hypothetical protein
MITTTHRTAKTYSFKSFKKLKSLKVGDIIRTIPTSIFHNTYEGVIVDVIPNTDSTIEHKVVYKIQYFNEMAEDAPFLYINEMEKINDA